MLKWVLRKLLKIQKKRWKNKLNEAIFAFDCVNLTPGDYETALSIKKEIPEYIGTTDRLLHILDTPDHVF